MSGPARIAVAGMLAGVPAQGGATWAVLQYALGLRELGHEVVLVEEVEDAAWAAAAPRLAALAARFDLGPHVALVARGSGAVAGMSRAALERALDGMDVLLNLSGTLTDEDLLGRAGLRVYVDLDPAFTQLWHEMDGVDLGLDRHDRWVTIGMGLGARDCPIPDGGLPWITTPQPVVLSAWPVAEVAVDPVLTTVGHWRAYGSIHHDGLHLGQKAHALRPLVELPQRTDVPFRLALGIHPGEHADLRALREHGWQLVDPARVAGTPEDYAAWVRGSWAEFGVAKTGYVVSRCGWFSDRSLCYLASGRPVLAQDTGFGSWLPVGEGVLPFSGADDVVAGVEALRADYGRHRRAARALAEELFDARRVLPALLERL